MDSITQAVLGAAMGQVFLGKKLKNSALTWGIFAGTIPDLDVFSRLFLSHEVDGLIYHRGITHSIFFTILFSPFFGWLSYRFYQKGWNKKLGFQLFASTLIGLVYLAFLGVFTFLAIWTRHWFPIVTMLGLGIGAVFVGRRLVDNVKRRQEYEENATWAEWSWMFFFAILTHWLIDACTSYGTQIFEPFSSYRIAFDNISIVDPLYTVPLLIGFGVIFFSKSLKIRAIANWTALGVSSFYMAYTFYTKAQVDVIVENSLKQKGIEYQHFMTTPTIGNTILWQAIVETKDSFYFGLYSFYDTKPEMTFIPLPKNKELVQPYKDDKHVAILLWFAQDYYNITQPSDSTLQFNNLRFGIMAETATTQKDRYIFKHLLGQRKGKFDVWQARDVEDINIPEMFSALWTRLKGI